MRRWRGLRWLMVLAAAAVVALGSLAEASPRYGRGAFSAKPMSAQRGIRAARPAYTNRGVRTRSPQVNRSVRGARTGHGKRSVRGTRKTYSGGEGHSKPRPPKRKGEGYPPRKPKVGKYPPRDPRPPRVVRPVPIGPIGPIGVAPPPVSSDPGYQPPPRPPSASNPRPPRPQGPRRPARGPSGVPPPGEQRLVPDEVVVQLPPGTSPQALAALEARHQLVRLETQTFQLTGEFMVRWRIPDQRSVPAVIQALEADADVLTAQPNYLFTLVQAATGLAKGDPAQYAVGKLNLTDAHKLSQGNNVLIAVVDSGIDVAHPELAGMIAESFDALPGEGPHRHGTAMAGTIVARSRLLGVAPGSRILAARAFGTTANAQATTVNVVKGIDWAGKNGARVINMSFAGPRDPAIERELAAAYRLNIVLIAAAGNAGPSSPPLYPAADKNVIAVSATDAQDRVFDRANRGTHITIAAPGVDILAPAPRGAYQVTSGTSVAAAFVSGLAALLLERRPNLTPNQVRSVLQTTARDLGKPGRDSEYGAGLADAYRAVRSLQPAAADAVTSRRR
jgi:hypothetical protein